MTGRGWPKTRAAAVAAASAMADRVEALIGGRHVDHATGTPVPWAREIRNRAAVCRHVLRGDAVLYRAMLAAADIRPRLGRTTVAIECTFGPGVRVHYEGSAMPVGEFEGVHWDRPW